ncbi:MAG: transcriptional repressor [Bacteroidaceae bacterium]|nr:transcriptional repressor [Bacteroidaceae bacterium]
MQHQENIDFEHILEDAGIRVTAVRLLVLKAIYTQMNGAFSLHDIVGVLPTVDNSTAFRALSLFAEKSLLHPIDDGSGMQKYCLCRCADHEHCRGHVHITCTMCHQTICMTDVPIPSVPIPDGYEIHESEYVIKGLCPKCSKKAR